MTRLIVLFSFFLILSSSRKTEAQAPALTVSFFKVESSKDTRSSSETFILEGNTLQYSTKKLGGGGPYPSNNNKTKTCIISDKDLNQIWSIITEKHLDKTDSLQSRLELDPPFIMETIDITSFKNNQLVFVSIMGESQWLSDKPLYKNAFYLIAALREILAKCR